MTKDNTMPPRDAIERAVRHSFDTIGAGAGTHFTLEYEGVYYDVTAVRIDREEEMAKFDDKLREWIRGVDVMTQDKWPEVVAEFDKIEADIKRAMARFEARHNAEMDDMRRELAAVAAKRLQAYRNRIAAKMAEEDNK